MTEFILRWAINTIGVVIAASLFPGQISYDSALSVALFALVLGLINAILRPVVIVFTCPFFVLTLGLFIFIVNALLFWLASAVPVGVHVAGFGAAFLGALVVSVISFIASLLVRRQEK